jgi:hypothetical protein
VATRTGDPNTELLALLREHCPETADEVLAQIIELGASESGGLQWRSLTLGTIPGLNEFVGVVSPPISAISTVLSVVSGILDAISALLIDITDPFRALILAAYKILKDIISDLLGSGAYLYMDGPGLVSNQAALRNLGVAKKKSEIPSWLAGGTARIPVAPMDGFGAWASRFQQSFDDPGDKARPRFSDGAPLTAVFLVAAAPQLPDLARFGPLFEKLLDSSKFSKPLDRFGTSFPSWPDDPDRARLRSRSVAPDWRSWSLRDIGPPNYPLRELEKIPELLKAVLINGDSIVKLLKNLINAVKDKIKVLEAIVELVQQVIELLKALSSSGLHVLAVATNEGVEGLVEAFLTAKNRPGTDPATGELQGTNAILGACLLAGGSEIDPVAALTVWALLGQSGSMDQAFVGLHEDLNATKEQAATSLADASAALSEAWNGQENSSGATNKGIRNLLTNAGTSLGKDGSDFVEALGESERSFRVDLTNTVLGAQNLGAAIDPLLLAHVEATRRAQRRGARSLAMSIGPRQGVPAVEVEKP